MGAWVVGLLLAVSGCDSAKQPGVSDVQSCIQKHASEDIAITWGFKNASVQTPNIESTTRVGDRFEVVASAPVKSSGPVVGDGIKSYKFRVHLQRAGEAFQCTGVEKL
jgi:hypothetical protein